jgi:triosephosphate isomerase
MRRPIIAANWKMNMSIDSLRDYVEQLSEKISGYNGNSEVIINPPFTMISVLSEALRAAEVSEKVKTGAQNLFWEESGAYTGEISAEMLLDVGCEYVIIGHSERRQYFHEGDEEVNKKITAALKSGLIPIFCIGESEKERKAERTFNVVERQLEKGLAGFDPEDISEIVIAYEPIWAIGTGLTATPDQAQDVHRFIRDKLKDMYDSEIAKGIRIQYGGSVKPNNIKELMNQEDIDGALVGGASLDAESFYNIISFDNSK